MQELFGKGARWILILLLVQVVASVAIPSIAFLPGEQAYYTLLDQQTNAEFAGLSLFGYFVAIFKNNALVALSNLLPGLGVLSAMSGTYNTARMAQIAAAATGQMSPSAYSGYFFLFPHSWIELSGYAIAIFKALKIWGSSSMGGRPGFAKFIVVRIVFSACLVTVVILVAAAFEAGEAVIGLLAWIPFGLTCLVGFAGSRRIRGPGVNVVG
jgi:hypothetical protein